MDDLTADDEKAEETEAQIPLEELLLNAAEDGYQLDKPYLRASGLVSLGSIPVSRFFCRMSGTRSLWRRPCEMAPSRTAGDVFCRAAQAQAQFDVCTHRSH